MGFIFAWAALLVGIFYSPSAWRAIVELIKVRKIKQPKQLQLGIFFTAAGVCIHEFFWSFWRALPESEFKRELLKAGDYVELLLILPIIGYMVHLHVIWSIYTYPMMKFSWMVYAMFLAYALALITGFSI